MNKEVCVRTNSDWLQATLIDTMFNKIYFCLKKQPINTQDIQDTLNWFYDSDDIAGRAVYNSKGINKRNGVESYVDPKDWKKALEVRVNLYHHIQLTIDSNDLSKIVREYCYKYLLGIRDIFRNIVVE